MSIFNNILFLQDPTYARDASAVHASYAQGYGNRVASARVFAPLGHAGQAIDHRDSGAPARPSAPSANAPFPLHACG